MDALWKKALAKAPFSEANLVTQVKKTSDKELGGYQAFMERQKLYLEAAEEQELLSALMHLSRYSKANAISLGTGATTPRYSFRPLWLLGDNSYYTEQGLKISLPKAFSPEQMAYRLLDCGYNALFLGNPWSHVEGTASIEEVSQNLLDLRSYGIKLYSVLRLQEEESFEQYQKIIQDKLPNYLETLPALDGVMFFSHLKLKYKKLLLFPERVMEEVNLLKQVLQDRELIYYLDPQEGYPVKATAKWFEEILDAVPNGVTIAFSLSVGDPRGMSYKNNPLLKSLESSIDHSSTPLLPLLNVGGIQWGEGLWPTMPLQKMQNLLQLMEGEHPYRGFLPMTHHFPEEEGLLKGALWVAGQSNWHPNSVYRLMDIWLTGAMGVKRSALIRDLLKDCEDLSHNLQKLKNSTYLDFSFKERMLQTLVSTVELLKLKLKKIAPKDSEELYHHILYFLRDVKKMLLLWSQEWKVKLLGAVEGEDLKDSFWVQVESHASRGLGGVVRGSFLKEPHTNPKEPYLQKLIGQNR